MTSLKTGKSIYSQSKEIIYNVYKYISKMFSEQPNTDIFFIVAEATEVGHSSIRKIYNEGIDIENPDTPTTRFSSPSKTKNREPTVTNLDNFDLSVVNATIKNIYNEGGYPTVANILKILKTENNFKGSESSLRNIMVSQLKMKFGAIDNRMCYMERSDIVSMRRTYIQKMKNFRENNFIYLDETWVNENHSKSRMWHNKKDIKGRQIPIGKGHRLILLHAGGANGFVTNGLLLFKSKTKSEDYHDEMNGQHFEEWFKK